MPTAPSRPRILVTGSRAWTDTGAIQEALAQAWSDLRPLGEPVLVLSLYTHLTLPTN